MKISFVLVACCLVLLLIITGCNCQRPFLLGFYEENYERFVGKLEVLPDKLGELITSVKVPSFMEFKWSIGVTNTTAAPLWHLVDVGESDYGASFVFNSKLSIVEKRKSFIPKHDTIIDTAFETPSVDGVGYMLIRNGTNKMRVDRVNLKSNALVNVIPSLNATHISIVYMNRERYLISSNQNLLSVFRIDSSFKVVKVGDMMSDYPVLGKFFFNPNDELIYGGWLRNGLIWVGRFTFNFQDKKAETLPMYVWQAQSNNVNLLGIVEEIDYFYYSVSYFENDQFKMALGCMPLINAHVLKRKEVSINVELFTSTFISTPQ